MEIIKFKNKTWHEIATKDNPAFDYIYENQRLQEGYKGRKKHCLLICKTNYEPPIGNYGYIVIEIPINGDIIKKGIFWNFNYAETFAGVLAKSSNENSGLHLQNVNASTFEEVVRPLMKYMAENHHPHTHCMVTGNTAEISEGIECLIDAQYLVD